MQQLQKCSHMQHKHGQRDLPYVTCIQQNGYMTKFVIVASRKSQSHVASCMCVNVALQFGGVFQAIFLSGQTSC